MSFASQGKKGLQNQMNDFANRFEDVGANFGVDTIQRTPFGRPEIWTSFVPPADYVPGTLRNDWRFDVGKYNHVPRDKPRKSGKDAINESSKAFSKAKAIIKGGKDTFVTFVNNQHYAHKIEFEGGSPKQAPAGMARLAYYAAKNAAKKKGFK